MTSFDAKPDDLLAAEARAMHAECTLVASWRAPGALVIVYDVGDPPVGLQRRMAVQPDHADRASVSIILSTEPA